EQSGTPEDVYYRSETDFVAQFIGLANVLEAEIVGPADADLLNVRVNRVGDLLARARSRKERPQAARLFVRPEHIELTSSPRAGMDTLRGRVTPRSLGGAQTDYLSDDNGVPVRVIRRSKHADTERPQDALNSSAPGACRL